MKFLSLLQSAIVYGTIILYGAVGEILTEKPVTLAIYEVAEGKLNNPGQAAEAEVITD